MKVTANQMLIVACLFSMGQCFFKGNRKIVFCLPAFLRQREVWKFSWFKYKSNLDKGLGVMWCLGREGGLMIDGKAWLSPVVIVR